MIAGPTPLRYSRTVRVSNQPDVLVCGIGCAGVAAAVAAARMGAECLAVEQWPFAGGNTTVAAVNGCCGLADMTTGELAVGGVVLELLAGAATRADRAGGFELPLKSTKLFEPITDKEQIRKTHTRLPYTWDTEKFKHVADRLLIESKVEVLYHTSAIDVIASGSRIECVLIADKEGIRAVQPKVVIDCTGDGNIAAWAGVPCEVDSDPQPGTLEFYIGSVHIPWVESDVDAVYKARQDLQNTCSQVFEEAYQAGELDIYGGPFLSWPAPGIVRVNAIRQKFNALSASELTAAEIRSRDQAWKMFSLVQSRVDEFRDAYFSSSGPALGLRESRRIRGEYTLTLDDILATRRFPDAIVKGAWYLDRHPSSKRGYHPENPVPAYDIPYRTLVPKGMDNVLVAGRSHSATTEALASSRVGVTAMGMGQAAGTAAAIAVSEKVSVREMNIATLRAKLKEQGAIL